MERVTDDLAAGRLACVWCGAVLGPAIGVALIMCWCEEGGALDKGLELRMFGTYEGVSPITGRRGEMVLGPAAWGLRQLHVFDGRSGVRACRARGLVRQRPWERPPMAGAAGRGKCDRGEGGSVSVPVVEALPGGDGRRSGLSADGRYEQWWEATPGAVRLRRSLTDEARAEGRVMPWERSGAGGAGSGGGRTGRPIEGMSARSRREVVWRVSGLPFDRWTNWAMVTCTLPAKWRVSVPDGTILHDKHEVFRKRVQRWFATQRGGGPRDAEGVWWIEYQPRVKRPVDERRAPHIHHILAMPDDLGALGLVWDDGYENTIGDRGRWVWPWALGVWCDVVGSGEPMHRVRGVDWSRLAPGAAPGQIAAGYIAKWAGEAGKALQKAVPDDFDRCGRQWGTWGGRKGFAFRAADGGAIDSDAAFFDARRMFGAVRQKRTDRSRAREGTRGIPIRGVSWDGRRAGDGNRPCGCPPGGRGCGRLGELEARRMGSGRSVGIRLNEGQSRRRGSGRRSPGAPPAGLNYTPGKPHG